MIIENKIKAKNIIQFNSKDSRILTLKHLDEERRKNQGSPEVDYFARDFENFKIDPVKSSHKFYFEFGQE